MNRYTVHTKIDNKVVALERMFVSFHTKENVNKEGFASVQYSVLYVY